MALPNKIEGEQLITVAMRLTIPSALSISTALTITWRQASPVLRRRLVLYGFQWTPYSLHTHVLLRYEM